MFHKYLLPSFLELKYARIHDPWEDKVVNQVQIRHRKGRWASSPKNLLKASEDEFWWYGCGTDGTKNKVCCAKRLPN